MKYWFSFWVFLYVFQTFSQSDYERAVKLFEEADSIRYTEDNKPEKDKGNYRIAILKFEEARDIFNAVDSTYYGFRCEVGVLKCQYYTGELELVNTQNIKSRLVMDGIQDSLLGFLSYYEGVELKNKFKYHESKRVLNDALKIFKRFNMIRESVNAAWFNALVNSAQGNFIQVISYYQTALELLKSSELTPYSIRSLFLIQKNTIEIHLYLGDYESHKKAIIECKKLAEDYPDWIGQSNINRLDSFIAGSYLLIGNYEKAYDLLKVLYKKYAPLFVIHDLAQSMKGLGKLDECRDLYQNQLRITNDRWDRAGINNNIGTTYIDLGRLDSAELYINRALELNLFKADSQRIGINLGNLGDIFNRQEKYKKADSILLLALTYPSTNRTELKRLLSKNYLEMRQVKEAINYAELAVFDLNGNLVEQYRGNPFRRKIAAYKWLLLLYSKLRSINKLEFSNDRSIELIDKVHHKLRNTYSFYGDEMLSLTTRLAFIYEYGINYCESRFLETGELSFLEKAFQLSEWSKVQALERAKKTPGAKLVGGLPKEILDLESRLKIHENFVKSQLSNSNDIDSAELERNRDKLFEIQQSQDSLENIIRINYPRYHQLRYQDITLSVEEVQERLQPSQAFVEYYEGDTTSFVFTITKDDYQVKRIHLDDDTLITRYREHFEPNKFSRTQQEVNELSHKIYQNYLRPAIGALNPEITELIVVPDGKLSYVPFDILLTEATQSQGAETMPYLLRDYQVHYTYSASLYFNDFSTLSTKDEYLAFAPEYETTMADTSAFNRLGSFRNQVTPLKYNQEEVAYISSQFKGLGYFGANANEKNFKEKVDEYGVLHLAMHTIVDDEDPMNSKLVFANSKDSLEDDMLHAFEIYNMEIPSKLAVLSACETGFGQLAKGEGALSLARAFSYAGSPSVVMSHWPVDDQTTAVLMKSFYNYLSKGLPKSDALRRSKLDFLDQTHSARMHPFFWGSFVVMGDDSPIYIKRLPQVNPFWVLMVCFLILGGAGFVVHRYEL